MQETKNKVVKKTYNYTKTRKKVKPMYRSARDYDFFQYIRVIFRWATAHTNLSRPEIEMLLYLYPKGTFVKSDFLQYQKLFSMYQLKALNSMIEGGWIYLWRPRKGSESALYALTNKAKQVCSKMHQFAVGDKAIPVKTRTNPLIKSPVRIDGYYMDMINKMNKERDKLIQEKGSDE